MYDPNKSELQNLFDAVEEQTKLIKETNDLLRQQLAFWKTISSEEYFNEVVAKDGIFPK